ncbi:MAG: hypothetical protein ABIF01_04685, partial [Candidatus Micrarchaeota archaeon]
MKLEHVLMFLVLFSAPSFSIIPTCDFHGDLSCFDFFLDSDKDNLILTVFNGYPLELQITKATCKKESSTGEWTVYPQPIVIPPKERAKITIDGLYDSYSNRMDFYLADIYTGQCTLEFFFPYEGPG